MAAFARIEPAPPVHRQALDSGRAWRIASAVTGRERRMSTCPKRPRAATSAARVPIVSLTGYSDGQATWAG
jgi:hypothetical protein